MPICAGLALAAKKDRTDHKVFTLLGDGELAEGSNYEAAMMASHYKLDNLVAILDHNTLQITARNRDVCSPYPIDEKFKAFGWSVVTVNGNNIPELRKVLHELPAEKGKPTLIIANTVKGKGISFMEDEIKWHHGVPSDDQYKQAMEELDEQEKALEKQLILN